MLNAASGLLTLLLLAGALPDAAQAAPPQKRLVENDYDHVLLTDGKQVKARVLYEDDLVVVVRQGTRKEQEFPRAQVSEVRSVERNLAQFLDRVAALQGTGDLAAAAELAAFCDASGLPHEARLTRLHMLTRDPANEAAWTGLGGRKGAKGWQLEDEKKWRSFDEYQAAHQTWKERFELRSTHFLLESDLPLADNLRALVTLEEFYRVFYRVLTPTLRLYNFDELPLVRLTRDASQYPTPPVARNAWFSVLYNTLDVYVPAELDVQLVVHEFTRGMIHNALRNTLRKDGQVAPWAAKGLCEWFAGGTKKGELRMEIDIEQPNVELIELHARAASPIPLKQLLVMAPMEFESGPRFELGSAQAYTLLLFLVRGAERKHRAGLLEFVHSSYEGKGSPTHFRKLVADDLDALEAEWTAWVKAQAGG